MVNINNLKILLFWALLFTNFSYYIIYVKMFIPKIKKILKFNYSIENSSRELYYFLIRLRRILSLTFKSNRYIFEEYYKKNSWGSEESFSGPGSTKKNTYLVRKILKEILIRYQIKSMSDIPCGDFNWMKYIDLKNVKYTGYDIVSDIIKNNNVSFSNETIKFNHLNIIKKIPKKSDLIFCRDALVHFSNKDVINCLQNFKKSDSKYLLTTTFPYEQKNKWIKTGMWRSINLTKPPFNFPEPIELFCESKKIRKKSLSKFLGLWKLSDLNLN